jgi:DNA-binding beta-propeller fold protein YncE
MTAGEQKEDLKRMTLQYGSGRFTYEVDEAWGQLPAGWQLGDVAGVSVDASDNVYVFHRGPHPMIVFDRAGNVLDSWGDEVFTRPHSTFIAPDQTIYCTDDGDHTVRHCTLDGRVLSTYGTPHQPAPYQSGRPFNRCTHAAMSPEGDLYVSDGYGNAKVYKFAPDGRMITSWGSPGTDPGQFNLPHNICCDAAGRVYVADRENHRIQVFDGDGNFLTQWNNLHRPSALYLTPGPEPVAYIGEIGPYLRSNSGWPNVGPRVSIRALDGSPLARLGTVPSAGTGPGQFLSPHGLTVDSRGDVYVGDVGYTAWPSLFPGRPVPEPLRCLQKFVRVAIPDAAQAATPADGLSR